MHFWMTPVMKTFPGEHLLGTGTISSLIKMVGFSPLRGVGSISEDPPSGVAGYMTRNWSGYGPVNPSIHGCINPAIRVGYTIIPPPPVPENLSGNNGNPDILFVLRTILTGSPTTLPILLKRVFYSFDK